MMPPPADGARVTAAAWESPAANGARLTLLYLAHRADLQGSRLVVATTGELVAATRLTRRAVMAAIAELVAAGDLGYAATNSYVVHPNRKAPR